MKNKYERTTMTIIVVTVLILTALIIFGQTPSPKPTPTKAPSARVVPTRTSAATGAAATSATSATSTYSIVFVWDAYAQPNSITGFTLYEHTGGTTYVAVGNITPAVATTYTLDNVSAALHSYVLTAVNSNTGGESAQSNEVTVNVPVPPSAPTNLRASVSATNP